MKPEWLRVRVGDLRQYHSTRAILSDLGLWTVCEAAYCPNTLSCWSARQATFMILGDRCTRSCRFCGIETSVKGRPVEDDEGERILAAARRLGLDHVVLTSVTRDDLGDGGASHFAECIHTIKAEMPHVTVEALVPDLQPNSLATVLAENPDVMGHNIEVVKKLQEEVRDRRASYAASLCVLRQSRRLKPDIVTKSSLMLGLGESKEDVLDTMRDLLAVGVSILTIGQYLRPLRGKIEVGRYVPPEEFDFYRMRGERMGFPVVVSAPFVRSSYRAADVYRLAMGEDPPWNTSLVCHRGGREQDLA